MSHAALALLLLLTAWPGLAAADEGQVLHRLSFPQRQNQYVHVRSEWPVSAAALELAMASWNPGSYLIRDFAGEVEGFSVHDGEGRVLPFTKVAKNRWRLEVGEASRVIVDYDIWAGELSVATSWVEADFALLAGAGVFLYSEASRSWPQQVQVDLPETWAAAHTPLLAVANARNTFLARDFDELVDSPIVAGNLERYPFEVQGQSFALLQPGGNPLWNAGRARDDLSRMVAAQLDFWGNDPFDREYMFFNFFLGGLSGLEHDHGTVMMASPWQMSGEDDYVKWLGLAAHEFFHAWNTRRLRPAALVPYDYDREAYTRELWLAEGLSSYYDDLLLYRAGLIDIGEYLKLLAQEIRNYEILPGRQVRSAEQASFDTWVKYYHPDENSINSTVSYYRKGTLIGFVVDTAIRRETRNRSSLDDVMRAMYQRYGPKDGALRGYPPGAFEATVEEFAGPGLRPLLENLLRSTGDPDVDTALAWYGLRLERDPGGIAAETGSLGVVWDDTGENLLAQQVIRGHAAADAGMLPADELLAIDGYRVTPQDYLSNLRRLSPGQRVELTLVRHHRLLTLPVRVGTEFPEVYRIVVDGRVSNAEKERLEAWLGRDLQFLR